jgi:hypothetical protein
MLEESRASLEWPDDSFASKQSWVQVDPEVPSGLWSAEREVDYNTCLSLAWCAQALLGVLRRLLHWLGMCIDARGKNSGLLVPTAEGSWEELSNPWPRVSSSGSCTKDMEALSVRAEVWCLYRPQESEVHIHPVGAEYETTKMVRIDQRLWIGNSYHPSKVNVVADALSRKSQVNMMVAHPMPYKLAKEFGRLSLGFLNNMRWVTVELEPTLEREIKEAQKNDEKINEIR